MKRFFIGFLVLFPCLCFAGSVHLNPVLLVVDTGTKNTSFTIENESDKPMLFQLKAVKWTQENGEDVHTDTQDLIINPPIVSIPPQDHQMIRVGLRAPLTPLKEHSYRVIATQVPLDTEESKTMALRTMMRFTLPLFVPPQTANKDISLKAKALPDGNLQFQMTNTGNTFIKLSKIDFVQEGQDKSLATDDILNYLLPGQERTWSLMSADPKSNKNAILKLTTDRGVMESPVS